VTGSTPADPGRAPVDEAPVVAFRAVHPNDRPLSSSGTSALRADGQTHDAAYVHGVRIDGTPHPRTWLTAAELDTAAELRFELGTTPGEWGTDEAAVPPSLTRSVEVPDVVRDVLGVGDVPPGFERLVDDRSSSGSVELPTHGVVLRLEQPVDAELYTLTSPRAVAVVVDAGRVLVLRRHRDGRTYAVLPGGSVEPGESPEQAAVRELAEETTLTAQVDRLLTDRTDGGRPASYFLVADVQGTPVLSGPEAARNRPEPPGTARNRPDNSYQLTWATADELDAIELRPVGVRAFLRELLETSR